MTTAPLTASWITRTKIDGKNMKNKFIIALAVIMCICLLAACGKQTEEGSNGTSSQSVTDDAHGFESVSDGELNTTDTENESVESESTTAGSGSVGNSDGIVELPTVPV